MPHYGGILMISQMMSYFDQAIIAEISELDNMPDAPA
jgi:hypothetical protein